MNWVVLFHTVVFLLFWLTNLILQEEVNIFLTDATGLNLNFLLIFILFTLAVGAWNAIQLALRRKSRKPGPPWLYQSISGFYLAFYYGSFIILFIKNPVQIARLGQMIQYFRIFFDVVVLFLLAWGIRRWLKRTSKTCQKGILIGGLSLLWLAPVFWVPGAVYRGALPEKPLLMAHRGASMLAPENTLASMQAAADLGVYGVETDLTVSYDGMLFLMHDSALARTTNVAAIFPGREKDPADSFTWAELSQLDASQWFVGQVLYMGEPIPTLGEVLQIVRDNNLDFIYDLRIPADDHPYAEQALDLCLSEIQVAGVSNRTWVLANLDEIPTVRASLPEAILAKGLDYRDAPAPQELMNAGYQLVNSEFGLSNRMIHSYQTSGLWVNLWTVDEPWQYSRVWLAGADSVTSNNVQILMVMPRPVLAIPYSAYLGIWGLTGILLAALTANRRK